MKFSINSEKLMKSTMHNFSKFLKKRSLSQQKGFDKILKKFYKEIYESDKFIKESWNLNNITLREVHHFDDIKHGSLINSSYLPNSIKEFIKNNGDFKIRLHCLINF